MENKGQKVIAIFVFLLLALILTLFNVDISQLYENQSITNNNTYQIDRVVDGDTLIINKETYRLLCIDFPDLDSSRIEKWLDMGISQQNIEKCYSEGISALNSMLLDKDVTLSYDSDNLIDKYDRKLAYVSLGTTDIGSWLIQNGYAIQAYSPCSKELEYQIYEERAKLEKTGCLWKTTQ